MQHFWFIFLVLLFFNSAHAESPVINKAMGLVSSSTNKTKSVARELAQVVSEPIRNPKAAVKRWFEFDPRIESGEKTNFNILPLFVSSPERGIGFGIKFAQASILKKEDVLNIQTVHTVNSKQSHALRYLFSPNNPLKLTSEIKLTYENYERFYYGLGTHTQQKNESSYSPEYFELQLPLLRQINKNWATGFLVRFQNWKMISKSPSGILKQDEPSLFGVHRTQALGTGLLLRYDTRNHPTDPSRGLFLETSYESSRNFTEHESYFFKRTLEVRYFNPIKNNQHVLALRCALDYRSGDVPYYLLPELGGIYFTRGLIEGRFRDRVSFITNVEYRLKIYQRLHWAFFIDEGNVFPEFKGFSLQSTKITGGTGMRYYVPPGNLLLARIDAAASSENFLVYLTFDQPF